MLDRHRGWNVLRFHPRRYASANGTDTDTDRENPRYWWGNAVLNSQVSKLGLFAAGLAILLVLLDQAPEIGGWFLLILVIGLLVLHPQQG